MSTPLPPIPCPSCGHPDDWRQIVELPAHYELFVREDGTYRFGNLDPHQENETVQRYTCNWCDADANLETREAIEERVR